MNRSRTIFLGILLGIAAVSLRQLPQLQFVNAEQHTVEINPATNEPSGAEAISTPAPTDIPNTQPTLTTAVTNQPAGSAVIPLVVQEPTPLSFGPSDFPEGMNPLTGLTVDNPTNLDRRPLVIKITNYPRSVRPQSGLSQADLVYEYYMERGISRFAAVFYGTDAERVGPVRSGRFFDQHIFQMYDGFFIFGFADERVFDFFETLGDYWLNSFILDNGLGDNDCMPGESQYLCRDRSLITYNNLFANTGQLSFIGRSRGLDHPVDLSGMYFSPQTPDEGALGLTIRVRYSLFVYNRWAYNVTLGRYQRFQETIGDANPNFEDYTPHLDASTGEQLAADNVVALFVPHYYFVKTPTTEIVNIPLYGTGDALVFRDGYAYPATWYRPSLEVGALQLLTPEGEPFPLKPGTTWFQVLNTTSGIEHNGGDWRFLFSPPYEGTEPINPDAENPPWGIYQDEIFADLPVRPTIVPSDGDE